MNFVRRNGGFERAAAPKKERRKSPMQPSTLKPLFRCLVVMAVLLGGLPAAAETGSVVEYSVPTMNSQPVSIVAGPDGNLWFTEFRGNKIARMTSAGTVTEFSIPTVNSQPDDMDVGPDGNLWFAEVLGNRIGRITTAGVITEFVVPTPNSRPTVVAAGPDGNLWFTERGHGCESRQQGRPDHARGRDHRVRATQAWEPAARDQRRP